MGEQPNLARASIFPERELPDARIQIDAGRALARSVGVGDCAFLSHYQIASEAEYKRRRMAAGELMVHAQVGYRDRAKTLTAYREIHARLDAVGQRVDRCGICLDWSMGYPAARRAGMPRGTGLILDDPEDYARLTAAAPMAPHFGDFVIGMPAALENTAAALCAGATSIGNLGQYFTFRLPHWHDDLQSTAATVQALALAAAQPVEILIHSNLDDGFAALFGDLCCALGAVLIEQHIVDDLLGGHVSHCYGHTYTDTANRIAFQRALARVSRTPGTMVYGNTTEYGPDLVRNYAHLAAYLMTDIQAQLARPSGHAVNPVPVSEALRIPDLDEIIAAHLYARDLIVRGRELAPLVDLERLDARSEVIVAGAITFKDSVLRGLEAAGIDTADPIELLLALRRVGAKRLETLYGPGVHDSDSVHGRRPRVPSSTLDNLERCARRCVESLDPLDAENLRAAGLTACVSATDVHEYGKLLVQSTLAGSGVRIIDAGVSSDPEDVVKSACAGDADFIAISTYNGIALNYLRDLRDAMERAAVELPVYIGGKLNQIPESSNTSLPVDVSAAIERHGAIPCLRVEDLLAHLTRMARDRAAEKLAS